MLSFYRVFYEDIAVTVSLLNKRHDYVFIVYS